MSIHEIEISPVDLVFQDLIVCGIREQATRVPAIKPIISALIIFKLYHVEICLQRTRDSKNASLLPKAETARFGYYKPGYFSISPTQ